MTSSLQHEWYTVTFFNPVPNKSLTKSELSQRIGVSSSRISDTDEIICLDDEGKSFSFLAVLPDIEFDNEYRTIDGPFSNPKIEPF